MSLTHGLLVALTTIIILTMTTTSATTIAVDIIPCTGQVTYDAATSLCAARQAQLCSKTLINSGVATKSKCAIANTRVWTNTPCVNSKNPSATAFWVVDGAGSDAGMCSMTSSSNTHAVVCCQGSSSTTTSSPSSSSNVPSVQSPAPTTIVTTLNNNNNLFFSPQPCSQITYSAGIAACASSGGRLCTRQELQGPSLNRKTLSCQNTLTNIVWSSTSCTNAKFPTSPAVYGVLGGGDNSQLSNGGEQCAVADNTHTHFLICCNDGSATTTPSSIAPTSTTTPSSVPPTTTTPPPTSPPSPTNNTPTTPKPTSIHEYENTYMPTYQPAGGNLPLSFFAPQPCSQATYLTATTACAAGNGRLCTLQELEGAIVNRKTIPCQSVLTNIVWSSTPCSSSKFPTSNAVYGIFGNGPDPSLPDGGLQCAVADDTHTHFIMCCTDGNAGPPSPDTTAPTPTPAAAPQPTVANAPTTAMSQLLLPPEAAFTGKMAANLLLIIVDDLKPSLSSYGDNRIQTPNMDRIASRGVRFSRAYTQLAECGPSRASFLTSIRPDRLQVYDLKTYLRDKVKNAITLGQAIKSANIASIAIGKVQDERCVVNGDEILSNTQPVTFISGNDMCYDEPMNVCKAAQGWDPSQCKCVISPGITPNAGSVVPSVQYVTTNVDTDYVDTRAGNAAAGQLANLLTAFEADPINNRFFHAVGFRKPHLPFAAPHWFFDSIDANNLALPTVNGLPSGPRNPYTLDPPPTEINSYSGPQGTTPTTIRQLIQGYLACVLHIDEQVGKLMTVLDSFESGMNNTIVVLMGDHGYHLGDHGAWAKHDVLEQDTITPFVIAPPPARVSGSTSEWHVMADGGKVVGEPVELLDLIPTMLDMLGLSPTQTQYTGDVAPVDFPMTTLNQMHVQIAGRSLRPLLTSQRLKPTTPWFSRYAGSQYPRTHTIMGYAVKSRRYRFVAWITFPVPRGSKPSMLAQEFYDYLLDPNEALNAVSLPQNAQVVGIMRSALVNFITQGAITDGIANLPGDNVPGMLADQMVVNLTPILPTGMSQPASWRNQPSPYQTGTCFTCTSNVRFGFQANPASSWWDDDLVQRAIYMALGVIGAQVDTWIGVQVTLVGKRRVLQTGASSSSIMFDVGPFSAATAANIAQKLSTGANLFVYELDQALQSLYYTSPDVTVPFIPSQEVYIDSTVTPQVMVIGTSAPGSSSLTPSSSPAAHHGQPTTPPNGGMPTTANPAGQPGASPTIPGQETSTPTSGTSNGTSGGAIAGIVIGVLIIVLAFAICAWWFAGAAIRDKWRGGQSSSSGGEDDVKTKNAATTPVATATTATAIPTATTLPVANKKSPDDDSRSSGDEQTGFQLV